MDIAEQELFQRIIDSTYSTIGSRRSSSLQADHVKATPPSVTFLAGGSSNATISIPLPSYPATSSTTRTSGSQALLSSTGSASSISSTRRIPPQNATPQSRNTIQMPSGAFVLLGVSKSYNLQLAHIDKRQYPDDSRFFRQLKRDYNQKRGILRRWLGLYQFHHCEFVEVNPQYSTGIS